VRVISRKIHLKEDIGVVAGTHRSEDFESGLGAIVTRQSRGWSRTLRDLMRAAPRDLPDIGHPAAMLLAQFGIDMSQLRLTEQGFRRKS
jgi:hypothetical protein